MPDINHYFQIEAPPASVFYGISTPRGLDLWWTKNSGGKPAAGETYRLDFGPGNEWTGVVSRYVEGSEFELTLTVADDDWIGTKVGCKLIGNNGKTDVQFYHSGWKNDNDHYRISNYCWAMYLRILKRNLEFGEEVKYEDRLKV